jgi:hypothetical protein
MSDADSIWMDGYFEEMNLDPIYAGDPAKIELMGYRQILHGHVDSIVRAINISNAAPNGQPAGSIKPFFTWGVPGAANPGGYIHVDRVPQGIILAAGMPATVQIDLSAGERW